MLGVPEYVEALSVMLVTVKASHPDAEVKTAVSGPRLYYYWPEEDDIAGQKGIDRRLVRLVETSRV